MVYLLKMVIFHAIYGNIWCAMDPINIPQSCYPLVNVHIAMDNHHAISGKIHYFYGHFQ